MPMKVPCHGKNMDELEMGICGKFFLYNCLEINGGRVEEEDSAVDINQNYFFLTWAASTICLGV